MGMPYNHFSREEFAQRQEKTRGKMTSMELDGLLLFKIEDMYWLCGFESDGFCIFSNMFIGTNGALTHLVRPADLGNVAYSSSCDDVRVSLDSESRRNFEWPLRSGGAQPLAESEQARRSHRNSGPVAWSQLRQRKSGFCARAPTMLGQLALLLTHFRRESQLATMATTTH